jgi:hypothetical protein
VILRAGLLDAPAVGGEFALGSAEGMGMVDVVYGTYAYVVSLVSVLRFGLLACGDDDIWDASRVAVVQRDRKETRSKRLEPSRARSTLGSSSVACVCVCMYVCI